MTSALVERDDSSVVTSSGDRYLLDGNASAGEVPASDSDATSWTR